MKYAKKPQWVWLNYFFKQAACFETFPESSSVSEVSIDILIVFLCHGKTLKLIFEFSKFFLDSIVEKINFQVFRPCSPYFGDKQRLPKDG